MKKLMTSVLTGIFAVSLVACSSNENIRTTKENTDFSNSNVLIAYFAEAENSEVDVVSSASVVTIDGEAKGRIRALADMIQSKTGGDLFSIQTSVKYPAYIGELIDYADEEQAENIRPELTSSIENLDQYDVIFVGYPKMEYSL